MADIPGVSSIKEIIERYPDLSQKVKDNLTDYTNQFMGLMGLEDNKEDIRRASQQLIETIIARGEEPFRSTLPKHLLRDILESLKKKDNKFSELDKKHVEEVVAWIDTLNREEKRKQLTQQRAHLFMCYLDALFYGRLRN